MKIDQPDMFVRGMDAVVGIACAGCDDRYATQWFGKGINWATTPDERIEKGIVGTLEHIVSSPFERMSYTEAVTILEASGQSFEFPVTWGADLQSEHERFLTEEHVQRPLVVTDYPAEKAFYRKLNDECHRPFV